MLLDKKGSSCHSSHNESRSGKKIIVHPMFYEYSDDLNLQVKENLLML